MSAEEPALVNGTCVALAGAGVLIRGEPGQGKSDLALRLLHLDGSPLLPAPLAARLVSDDYVELRRRGPALMASPPATIAGRMEVRGVGVISLAHASGVPLRLVVDLVGPEQVERLPEPCGETATLAGVALPRVALYGLEPSAPAKVCAALSLVLQGGMASRNSK